MIGIFDKQVLALTKVRPPIGIGLLGCQEDPDVVIKRTARELLGLEENDEMTPLKKPINKDITSEAERVRSRQHRCCYETMSHIDILQLSKPRPKEIKFDPSKLRKIQMKLPKLWSKKTGKFRNMKPEELSLIMDESKFIVCSKEWSHPKEKYNAAKTEIEELYREGILEFSRSKHANNIVIVDRKQNHPNDPKRVRVCLDARNVKKYINTPQNKVWTVKEV